MHLEPILQSDLPGFISTTIAEYAEQKSSMGGVPLDEAREQAEQEAEQLFPNGELQPGHAVLIAVGNKDAHLGRVWLAPHPKEPKMVFVYDIDVASEHRGHGYGRELMQLAHEWAKGQGYTSVSLHVFGGNTAAIGLYESLEYQVADLVMRRDL